jgi:mRNA interferase RelE/StbE
MSKYTIIIAPIARKQIERLHPAIIGRVANALVMLADNPLAGKALKWDLKGLYAYRVGDYRILYHIVRRLLIIEVVKVMHRRESYR